MIFETIEPIALRIPNRTGALHFVFRRVRTRDGVEGFGECLCGRPAMQRALMATIGDAISLLYLGKSIEDRQALNLEVRRRFASFGRSGPVLNALAAVDMAL